MRDIFPPADFQEYTNFASSIDLYSARVRYAVTLEAVTGSGSLQVVTCGSRGVARTITLAAGQQLIGQFQTIVSSSGITRVRVGWN